MAFHNPWNELLWSNQIFHFQNFGKTLTSLGGRLLPLSVAILLVFVEVEVIQIQNWLYLILQVQSDQHEPELLGSPRSFYRSCSSPLIPDQHSKGICSGHCPTFVHLSIYVLYPLSEKSEVGRRWSLFLSQCLKNVLSTSQIPVSTSEMYWKLLTLER